MVVRGEDGRKQGRQGSCGCIRVRGQAIVLCKGGKYAVAHLRVGGGKKRRSEPESRLRER